MNSEYQAERNRLIVAIQKNRAEYARWNREAMNIRRRGTWEDLPRGLRKELQKDQQVSRPNAPMPKKDYETHLSHAEKMSAYYRKQEGLLKREFEQLDAKILRDERIQSALKERYERGFDR